MPFCDCPSCGLFDYHLLGQRQHRDATDDHVAMPNWGGTGYHAVYSTTPAGDYRQRECRHCGARWEEYE